MNNKIDSSNFALLIGLSHQHQNAMRNVNRYPNLHRFRQKIEDSSQGPQHQPYQSTQKKVLFYQIVFILIGMLFLFLCALSYTHTMNWSTSFLFENTAIAKIFLCSFCFITACSSLGVASSMRTEREALINLVHRAQKKLKRIHAKKIARLHLKPIEDLEKERFAQAIKVIYQDTLEKVLESKEVAVNLVAEIVQSEEDTVRIDLFNEAILELNDRLHYLIQRFKSILTEDFDL